MERITIPRFVVSQTNVYLRHQIYTESFYKYIVNHFHIDRVSLGFISIWKREYIE